MCSNLKSYMTECKCGYCNATLIRPKYTITNSKSGNVFCNRSCSRKYHNLNITSASRALQTSKQTASIKRRFVGHVLIKKVHNRICKYCGGKFNDTGYAKTVCSDECRSAIRSRNAINCPQFGGNKSRNIIKHVSPFAGKVSLDSSWEQTLAINLDAANIPWIRPSPIKYDRANKFHRYFPDFYIPSLDLYVDPKNPWRLKEDIDKLTRVVDQNKINLLVITDPSKLGIENLLPIQGLRIV